MKGRAEVSFSEILDGAELVVVVGPGGVGKTTAAAALGLGAARQGRRVLVLTIDPARRLADAMGLDGLSDQAKHVTSSGGGRLDAAMLDTQSSYDALMRRLHADAEGLERIIENRVYQSFRRTLARSHAYIAMERLHEAFESTRYDLVVVDTPPMRNALEILDAPGSLSRFLDDSVLGWFLRPARGGRLSRLLPEGGAAARRLLGLLASRRLVDEMATFFSLLAPEREGFAERARAVRARLGDDSTRFLLVTSPAPTALDDSRYLTRGLQERDVRLDGIVFNRAFTAWPGTTDRPIEARAFERPPIAASEVKASTEEIESFMSELVALARGLAADNRAAIRRMRAFVAALRYDTRWTALAERGGSIHDLAGLSDLSASLLGDPPHFPV